MSINALKGLAALIIASGHYFAWGTSGGGIPSSFILAVDLFFVISGFTLTNAAYKKDFLNNQDYYSYLIQSRIIRLYLPYLFILLLYIISYIIKRRYWDLDLYVISMVLLLLQGWGFSFGETIINNTTIGIAWCLSVELYLSIFVFTLLFKYRRRPNIIIFICCTMIGICYNCLVNYSPDFMNVTYNRINLGIISITFGVVRAVLGYGIGIIIYYIKKYNNPFKIFEKNNSMSILEIIIIGFIILLYAPNYNRTNEYIFPIFAGIMTLLFTSSNGPISKLLQTKFFQKLGSLSFAIYLVHPIIISICTKWEKSCFGIYLIILLMLSSLFSSTIETYCLNIKNELLKKASVKKSI